MAVKSSNTASWIAIGLGLIVNILLIGVAYGKLATQTDADRTRIQTLERRIDSIEEKLHTIDKNTSVIAAWVETQKQSKSN